MIFLPMIHSAIWRFKSEIWPDFAKSEILPKSGIWLFSFLFILTLPVFNIKEIYESKTAMFIITETPILSKYTGKTLDIYNDLYDIIDNRESKTNEQVNEEAMKLMLEYDIITIESAQKLVDKNKVIVNDNSFIKNYNK